MDFAAFVLEALSQPPARVLEVGCGSGELALALDRAGHEVLAIDPQAPDGAIFRAVPLEALDDPGPFDAVVASFSLHHVADLGAALDRVHELLRPGGSLVLDEFGWDVLDEATADWYYGQRRALAAAGQLDAAPRSFDDCRAEWEADHRGLHGYHELRRELDHRFAERTFERLPYLYRELAGVATEALERSLIQAGAIQALGFRYLGTRV